MLLTLVLPTFRTGPSVLARVCEAVAWGGDEIEVLIRDNSQDPEKKKFLKKLSGPNVRIIFPKPCHAWENLWSLVAEARGEFILPFADDDFLDGDAIPTILETIRRHRDDPSVAGIIGDFMVTGGKFSSFLRFHGLDAATPAGRYAGFIQSGGCSVIVYAMHRAEIFKKVPALFQALPMEFSFHDLVMTSVLFSCGKYVNMERYLYCYGGMGNWNTSEAVIKGDFKYYARHNLQFPTYRLHWLFCAFEGAKIILGNQLAQNITLEERIELARIWMYDKRRRLAGCTWGVEMEGSIDATARALWKKWTAERESVQFDEVLADLTEMIACSNPEHAQRYFNFWSAY